MTDDNDNVLDLAAQRERKRREKETGESSTAGKPPAAKARGKQSDALVALAMDRCEFWHDHLGELFVTVLDSEAQANYSMTGKTFKEWLAYRYYQDSGLAPSANAVLEALAVLSGKARYEGPEYPTALRIGRHEAKMYLDLGTDDWRAVEIADGEWRIVKKSPVRFVRSKAMRPLPLPETGGDLGTLWPLINIDPQDRPLIYGWLAAALREDRYPYPVLALIGGNGSAKSWTARVLKSLIDPNVTPLRASPRDDEALLVAARSGHVIALDNLSSSGFKPWLSDALCRLATGGGLSKREQYSDDSEFVFPDTRRPILTTSIDMYIRRDDLMDRTLLVNLPTIQAKHRERESVLEDRFNAAHPKLLGALLDGIACALALESAAPLPDLPRMADAAQWISGAEKALAQGDESFLVAFRDSHREAVEASMAMSPLYAVLRPWLAMQGGTWNGTALDLLNALEGMPGAGKLPNDATRLSSALNRIDSPLRIVGIEIVRHPRERTGRRMTIRQFDQGD